MEQFINLLLGNSLYLMVAVIFSVAVLLLFLKKLLKVALVLLAVGVLFIAYLFWSGQSIPEVVISVEHFLSETIRKVFEFFFGFSE
jgi:hypothetical protein